MIKEINKPKEINKMFLLYCPHCKTFYKIVNTKLCHKDGFVFCNLFTDFGDTIVVSIRSNTAVCKCKQYIKLEDNIIECDDFILDKFFTTKV
jgi:predicted Zn finger-like uncharacterized protein